MRLTFDSAQGVLYRKVKVHAFRARLRAIGEVRVDWIRRMAQAASTVAKKPAVKSARLFAAFWSHRWFALALLVLACTGAWQSARTILGPAVVVDQVDRGNLIQTVVASGHVETPFRVEIGSQITGVVQDVLVEEGKHVVAGQPLISLEGRELNAAVVQARGVVAQAEARVRQIGEFTLPSARESLLEAQANLGSAQNTFNRTADLSSKGAATRVALDEAQKNLDIAKAKLRTAQLQYSRRAKVEAIMSWRKPSSIKRAQAWTPTSRGWLTQRSYRLEMAF
jgi:HlyD family secretion protein